MQRGATRRRRLLLLLAPADHPQRDALCATLAWVAEDEGSLFECYFAARASGTHFGGGDPAHASLADLRGGTIVGGHHLEQLAQLLLRFDTEVVALGDGPFDTFLADSGVPFRAKSPQLEEIYRIFLFGRRVVPQGILVVGDGGRPQGISLGPYAYPEIVARRLIAVADSDLDAVDGVRRLFPNLNVEGLWSEAERNTRLDPVAVASSVAQSTAWMSNRHSGWGRGTLLGDPELIGRWTPTAARHHWLPLYGLPQTDALALAPDVVARTATVWGRQQDDFDFLHLSRAGSAFQLVDPGRPPFPVLSEAPGSWPPAVEQPQEPSDDELDRWAGEGRIVSTLLFWTGMVRELENLYPLADVLSLTEARAGLILTTESFAHLQAPPLGLLQTPAGVGGLAGQVEVLIASGGSGCFLESEVPSHRFSSALSTSMESVSATVGSDAVPRGWWAVLDARLDPARRSRVRIVSQPPFVRVRYRRSPLAAANTGAPRAATRRLRARLRTSPIRHLFEAERPFDGFRPGAAVRSVLETVRDAGFEYAVSKSRPSGPPTVTTGVDRLTVINHTVGSWDGWTPFVTVGGLADLQRAERRLLRRGPGWLLGTVDSCLWTFTGPIWQHGRELRDMCDWLAGGGSTGRLVNVTPRTVARYAARLAATGRVATEEAAGGR